MTSRYDTKQNRENSFSKINNRVRDFARLEKHRFLTDRKKPVRRDF